MRNTARLIVAAGIAALSGSAFSQALPDVPYLSLRLSSAWLLNDTSIRKELKLTKDQAKSVDDAFDAYSLRQQSVLKATTPDPVEIEKIDKTVADAAPKALSEDQKKRLSEIALQLRGVPALVDDEIASKLKLDDTQKAKIKGILDGASSREEDLEAEVGAKIEAIPQPATPGDEKAYNTAVAAISSSYASKRTDLVAKRQADEASALATLTDDQKKAWTDLQGTKFAPPVAAPVTKPVVKPVIKETKPGS